MVLDFTLYNILIMVNTFPTHLKCTNVSIQNQTIDDLEISIIHMEITNITYYNN